jgi:diguanylate cyclase (GGDEF)-like protein
MVMREPVGEPLASTRWSAPARFGGAVAFVVVSVVPYALLMNWLLDRSEVAKEHAEAANEVLISARTIEGLEHRALAGEEDLREVRNSFADESGRLLAAADQLSDADRTSLEGPLTAYQEAVGEELDLLASNDPLAARELHHSVARPSIQEAIDSATSIADRQDERYESALRRVRVTGLLLSGLSAVSLVFVLWMLSVMLVQRRNTEERARLDRRYQSLVQGSQDLFTVVSGDDRMAILGSTELRRTGMGASAATERVSDLLPESILAEWISLDGEVRSGAGNRSFEFEVAAPDGSVSHVEGHGSLLDADTGERAWVWRDITGRKQLEMHLAHLALHDPLTGLANRTLFEDRIGHALLQSGRGNLPTTVLFCDIDKFKGFNDTLGHAGGDQLLSLVASRLLEGVRTGDTVARLGGDEFAVILENTGTRHARVIAERILAAISSGTTIDGHDIRPTVSIGMATSAGGSSPEEVIRGADLAMYEAKRAGGSRVVVFEDDLPAGTSNHDRAAPRPRPASSATRPSS